MGLNNRKVNEKQMNYPTGSLYKKKSTMLTAVLFLFLLLFSGGWAKAEEESVVQAQNRTMEPGETLNISDIKKATNIYINTAGTYTLQGQSARCMLHISAQQSGDEIRVIFEKDPGKDDEDEGFRLVATKDCPGLDNIARAAVTVSTVKGSKVYLVSSPDTECYFRSKANASPLSGCEPAIKKTTADGELIFDTVDPKRPGVIIAIADPKGYWTPGIGGTGDGEIGLQNVIFLNGRIWAKGSEKGGGGPGIGDRVYVNGLTFENAEVNATAGGDTAAAIGTATGSIVPGIVEILTNVTNITINGGKVHAVRDEGRDGDGGAGIGGGYQGDCSNVTINNGEVYAVGAFSAAGIGGGYLGNGTGIVINGGTVYAQGGATGIGGGHVTSMGADNQGQFEITIRQQNPMIPTKVTAIGGVLPGGGHEGSGVGIGGYMPKFKQNATQILPGPRTINIEGGTIIARGWRNGSGIGVGKDGYAGDINIHGGIITATGFEGAAIGGGGTDDRKDSNAGVGHIRIYGGTITAYQESCEKEGVITGPGIIGGRNYGDLAYIYVHEPVMYISGGNIYGKLYNVTPKVSKQDDREVVRNDIAIQTYGLSDLRKAYVKVESFTTETKNSAYYGLKDVFTLPDKNDEEPVLYFWLPKGEAVRSVKTETPYLDVGYLNTAKDQYEFFGITKANYGGTLYPPLCFLIDDNTAGDYENGPYFEARIGDSSEVIRNPVAGADLYSLQQDGMYALISAEGAFYADVTDSIPVSWTDAQSRLIIRQDEEGPDARENYTNGLRVYSRISKVNIVFEKSRPKTATTELTGDCPAPIMIRVDQPSVTLPAVSGLTLPGYQWTGWNTAEDGGGKHYDPGTRLYREDIPFTADTFSLYPEWRPLPYTILFRSGDGTGVQEHIQAAVFDQAGNLDRLETFGWTNTESLLGWQDTALGSLHEDGDDYFNLCTLNTDGLPEGRTLTAAWGQAGSITVAVSLDNLGVTGLEDSFSLAGSAASFDLHMIPGGHGIYTWTPAGAGALPPGTYNLLTSDERFIIPEGKTAFAWDGTTAVTIVLDYYTVSVKRGDEHITGIYLRETGTSAPKTELILPDDAAVRVEVTVAEGYHLDGFTVIGVTPQWEDPENPARASQQVIIRGKAEITAWSEHNVYTVVFDANGGEGTMDRQDMVYGEPQDLFPVRFSRTGNVFDGWNMAPDGSGTAYRDGQRVQNLTDRHKATVTLYARWKPVQYRIDYELNGGSLPAGKTNPAFYTPEDSFTLVNPVHGSLRFSGWTGTGLTDRTMQVTVPKGSTGSRSYTAGWSSRRIRIILFFDTGTGTAEGIPGPIAFDPDESERVRLPDNVPTKAGWYFTGWNTEENGSGTSYLPGEILTVREDLDLYAVWSSEPVICSISFDLCGGTLDGQTGIITKTYPKGTVITIPGPPVRKGYTFVCWQGSVYYPGNRYIVEEDHDFTAVWKKKVPVTGDRADPLLWLGLILTGLCGSVGLKVVRKSRK